MWNLVNIKGTRYLVDVTNCDSGTIGAPDKLFMAGYHSRYTDGDNWGYVYKAGNSSITYVYDKETKYLYSVEELTVADSNYEPGSCDSGHDLTAHEAHEATCTETGNNAYWSCSECGKYFSDEEGIDEITENSWITEAKGHDLEYRAAVEATCEESGNSEHWVCMRTGCGKHFADSAGETEMQDNSWIIPGGHKLTHYAAKTATCTEEGNNEYWVCARDGCGLFFSDEEGTEEIAENSWVTAAKGHNLEYRTAVEATCDESGNREHWICTRTGCGKHFADRTGETEMQDNSWIIPAGHHMTEHPAVAKTCTTDGSSAYWYCDKCLKYFSSANGTADTEIDENDWIILAGHNSNPIHHPAADASCTAPAYIEYWQCPDCGKNFDDEACTNEVQQVTNGNPLGHRTEYVGAVAATEQAAGNIEYWHCTVCGHNFSDEDGTNEIANITIPKIEPQPQQPAGPQAGAYSDSAANYTINANGTATFNSSKKDQATVSIPATVRVGDFDVPVTKIADKAFKGKKKLKTITIGANIREIGTSAFEGCKKLKTVKGGDNVEKIGDKAYKGCVALTKYTIGAKVNYIGKNAFNGCTKLKTITVKSTLLTSSNVKSGAFKKISAKATFKVPKAKKKEYAKFLPKKGTKTVKVK